MRVIEFKIGKKKIDLVAGLVWHPVHQSGSARTKEIREFAKTSGHDFKVLRGTESPHVGFAKKSEGAKAGQISAAAVVADAVSASDSIRNFLVALRIPDDTAEYKLAKNIGADKTDQFMYVAVHDGVILADGDMVGSLEEIKTRLIGDSAYEAWEIVICPDDWGVSRSQEKSFEDIFSKELTKSTGKWALKDVNLAWKKALIPLLLIVVIGTGTTLGYKFWTMKKAADAELVRLQAEEAAKSVKPAYVEPVKPWPKMAMVVPFAAACGQALKQVGLSGGNWQLKTVECSDGLLAVTWTKPNEHAWISHLKAVQPNARFAPDGLSASVTVPVDMQPSNNSSEVLPTQDGISLRYYDLGSRYGMTLRVDPPVEPAAPAALPGQQAGSPEMVPPKTWTAVNVQVDTKLDPVLAANIIAYPGLRLQKITYAFKTGFLQYQLFGVQYVRL